MPECPWCEQWVNMCYTAPCHGTLQDIDILRKNGKLWSLVLQLCFLVSDRYIHILVPAPKWNEWHIFFENPLWECNFLNEERLCSIHTIKPLVWKDACCKGWDTLYTGIVLRSSWKKDYNLGESLILDWANHHWCRELVIKILAIKPSYQGLIGYQRDDFLWLRDEIASYNLTRWYELP